MPLLGDKKYQVLNRSLPRKDGVEKVTGRAVYATDVYALHHLLADGEPGAGLQPRCLGPAAVPGGLPEIGRAHV